MSDTRWPAEISGERFDLRAAANGYAIVSRTDSQQVGAIVVAEEDAQTTIRSLCIDEPHRSYGAGSEAARLFTAACDKAGIERLRAWAHPNLGLSVYFWIRMGFSPLHGEGPEGGIWFERRRDADA